MGRRKCIADSRGTRSRTKREPQAFAGETAPPTPSTTGDCETCGKSFTGRKRHCTPCLRKLRDAAR